MLNIQENILESIETVSRDTFFDNFIWPSKPVVLKGLSKDWTHAGLWTPEFLQQRLNNKTMPVTCSDGNYDYHRDLDDWIDRSHEKIMAFDDIVAQINSPTGSHQKWYVNQKSMAEQFPELAGDYSVPHLIEPEFLLSTNLWFGSQGNKSALHYDQPNNLLVQCYGSKTLILFPPEDFENLYPSPRLNHFSRVHVADPDYTRHPKAKQTSPIKVTLQPGDTLYIPPFWWHEVNSDTNSISVNFFWRSYTHQLAVPAIQYVLPQIADKLPEKYMNYLPGKLPELVDFASHLCSKGMFSSAATVLLVSIRQKCTELLADSGKVLSGLATVPQVQTWLQGQPQISPQDDHMLRTALMLGQQSLTQRVMPDNVRADLPSLIEQARQWLCVSDELGQEEFLI